MISSCNAEAFEMNRSAQNCKAFDKTKRFLSLVVAEDHI